MALNSSNVRVAVTGAWYVGPTSTTAPTAVDSALTGFVDLGFTSDDGVTETRDRSTNSINAWQGAARVREVVTDSSISFQGILIETKKEVIELYYGTTVDTDDGSVKIDPGRTGGRKSFVIDVIDGDSIVRAYVPSGEITAVGDQSYTSGDAIGYDVTVTGYPVTVGGETYSAIKWYSDLVVDPG